MEVELKFQVPPARREALRRAVATRTAQRTRLQAIYADTADDRLAAAGLALRLRKEGSVWVQTLKGRGDGLMQRLEHEVPLPAQRLQPAQAPALDPARHAGSAVGAQLQRVLKAAGAAALGLGAPGAAALVPVYRTDIQRLHRTLSQGGARLELALDEGWIMAGDQRLPVFEIEFELKAGPPAALLALAQRWVQRFGLVWDVRTKSERGFRLARGLVQVPAVRAPAVVWPRAAPAAGKAAMRKKRGRLSDTRRSVTHQSARPGPHNKAGQGQALRDEALTPAQAWSALLRASLAQVLPNAAELACTLPTPAPSQTTKQAPKPARSADAAAARADHLHQLRVGLRRLRTVLALCADWSPDPPAARALQLAWREPFARLGAARDGDVLGGGLWPEIQAAGGPATPAPLQVIDGAGPVSPAVPQEVAAGELLRDPGFSLLLLQSLALSLPVSVPVPGATGADAQAPAALTSDQVELPDAAARLLRRTWRQVRRDARGFASLPVELQHRTRRRLKRLRYLLEGLLALPAAMGWPRRRLRRWHRRLCRTLDALGRYNDLCMADEALLGMTTATTAGAAPGAAGGDAGVWFARGWLAVQRPLAMAAAAQGLQRLAETPTPWPQRRGQVQPG